MKTQTAYKVEHQDVFCIVFLLSDALYLINEEIYNNYTKGLEPFVFQLSVIQMTEKEIEDLGEFEGF
jgi:hypothetical protein